MAYGNEDYRDFHYKSWKNLSADQQGNFADKNAYKAYKDEYGLDGFKSAKDKAQTYQFDKKWSEMDEAYQGMHTREQHKAARDMWKQNKGMDYESTSDAYKMMIDQETHGGWYKGGGNDPTPSILPHTDSDQGKGPVTDSYQPTESFLPTPESGERPRDRRNDGPVNPENAAQGWNWNNPESFWDKHTDGQNWGGVKDKEKYGEEGRLAYMTDAMGWGNYNDLNNKLKKQWEERGGRDAYRASRDHVAGWEAPGEEGSGSSGGGNYGEVDDNGRPVKQDDEKTSDYRDRVQEWRDDGKPGGVGDSGGGNEEGGGGGSGNTGEGINIVVGGGEQMSYEDQRTTC